MKWILSYLHGNSNLRLCFGGDKPTLELGFVQDKYLLFYDSHGAIHLGKNSTFHSRSKHIDVRYHWIRDTLDAKQLELTKVHTNDNSANMMTKAVPRGKIRKARNIVVGNNSISDFVFSYDNNNSTTNGSDFVEYNSTNFLAEPR
ncbi:hypothetical protein CR513_48413, partial [Mucuna pruriens]